MKPISKQELENRIMGYVKRMNRREVQKISLEEKGLYRIIGGNDDTLGFVKGRFIEAIAYAVQEAGFPGDWCSWNFYDNCNHGRVERITPLSIRANSKLNYLLNNRK